MTVHRKFARRLTHPALDHRVEEAGEQALAQSAAAWVGRFGFGQRAGIAQGCVDMEFSWSLDRQVPTNRPDLLQCNILIRALQLYRLKCMALSLIIMST